MRCSKFFSTVCLVSVMALFGVPGCSLFHNSDDTPPLPGERISVMALQKDLSVDTGAAEKPLELPEIWQNKFWPQAGGYPNHAMQNLDLSAAGLRQIWRVDIGSGSSDQIPLNTQPVVVDGRIFTIDAEASLRAFNVEDGHLLWKADLHKEDEDDSVIAGGIGFADNALYVTNGYNEVMALNPETGEMIWRKDITAPSRAAPSVLNGRVFVSTLDNKLVVLDASNGDFLWDYQGIRESAGLVGAASAALSNDVVIPAFSSGEVSALRVENGSVAWTDNLSNVRAIGGLSGISDVKALPVVDKGLVFAVSFGGKMVAIDERSGQRVWQRNITGSETPWVAGNHVFVLSSDNQLIALGREDGVIRWVTDLPKTHDGDAVRLIGPVLAGGRLIVLGSEGLAFDVNPDDGVVLREWSTGRDILIAPVVAGSVLYLLSEDGTLIAYK